MHITSYFKLACACAAIELGNKSRFCSELLSTLRLCIKGVNALPRQKNAGLSEPLLLPNVINRGSYMSAIVLLNSLNELEKKMKCEACRTFYIFFRNEINQFNDTLARMLDSIYHIRLKLIKNIIFDVKNAKTLHSFTQRYNGRQYIMLRNL